MDQTWVVVAELALQEVVLVIYLNHLKLQISFSVGFWETSQMQLCPSYRPSSLQKTVS